MQNLTKQEKNMVQAVLRDGLNLNPNINFAYFLDSIDASRKNIDRLNSEVEKILYNQRILNDKLDIILNLINNR